MEVEIQLFKVTDYGLILKQEWSVYEGISINH